MTARTTERDLWNERYRLKTGPVGPPAQWLLAHRELIEAQPRRRALDVACGRGRNALFLAEMGFAVDAIDVSDVALAALRETAAARAFDVRVQHVDLAERPELPAAAYDVIAVFYFLQRSLFPVLTQALAPGGLLVFETFTTGQLALDEGPSNERFVLRPGELATAFPTLTILEHRETEPVGGRPRAVAGLVARRD
jgi:SAM-dependent methyltransferase